jgi:hypothetical protein
MSNKKRPLVQLVRESFELCDRCQSGLRYIIRPKDHFYDIGDWRGWNHRNAGRPAGRIMLDEDGMEHCLVELYDSFEHQILHLWAEVIHHILRGGNDTFQDLMSVFYGCDRHEL